MIACAGCDGSDYQAGLRDCGGCDLPTVDPDDYEPPEDWSDESDYKGE